MLQLLRMQACLQPAASFDAEHALIAGALELSLRRAIEAVPGELLQLVMWGCSCAAGRCNSHQQCQTGQLRFS